MLFACILQSSSISDAHLPSQATDDTQGNYYLHMCSVSLFIYLYFACTELCNLTRCMLQPDVEHMPCYYHVELLEGPF